MIKTNPQGKVEVLDPETGAVYTNVKVMYIHVNIHGKAMAEITIKDVKLDIEADVR